MSRLIYIVGASGVGKDTLLQYARRHINGSLPLVFAHRYITRPAVGDGEGGENHIALTTEEFLLRCAKGLFSLEWEGNGLHYGIGKEMDGWMEKGLAVVVNGSRGYLETARRRYPDMIPILIEADPDIILRRLEARAREKTADIDSRFKRQPAMPVQIEGLIRITNNGLPEEGGNRLIAILQNLIHDYCTHLF